jgi:hypothetical protein
MKMTGYRMPRPIRPFFIAAGVVKEAEQMAGGEMTDETLGENSGYICSDHILDMWDVNKYPNITKIFCTNGGIGYVPLPKEHLIALLQAHGYEFYKASDLRAIAQKPVGEFKKSLQPQPPTPGVVPRTP